MVKKDWKQVEVPETGFRKRAEVVFYNIKNRDRIGIFRTYHKKQLYFFLVRDSDGNIKNTVYFDSFHTAANYLKKYITKN